MRDATLLVSRHIDYRKSPGHLWLVNADSTAARTPGTGGCTCSSRTDGVYVKAHAVRSALRPKSLSFVYKPSRAAILIIWCVAVSHGLKPPCGIWRNVLKRRACLMIVITLRSSNPICACNDSTPSI